MDNQPTDLKHMSLDQMRKIVKKEERALKKVLRIRREKETY